MDRISEKDLELYPGSKRKIALPESVFVVPV